jgi:hypothetical protein
LSNYNPYAAPQQDAEHARFATGNVTWDGKQLVVPKQYSFPRVCLKCASPEVHTRRTQKFAFTPMWARLMVLVCWMGALVAMAITTKRATLELPLCDPCHAKWKKARNLSIYTGLGLLVLIVGAVIVGGGVGGEAGLLALPVAILVGAVGYVVLVRKVVIPATLQSPKIDETYVTLAGVEPLAGQYVAGGGN